MKERAKRVAGSAEGAGEVKGAQDGVPKVAGVWKPVGDRFARAAELRRLLRILDAPMTPEEEAELERLGDANPIDIALRKV